jgi:hypothetical protein
VPQLSVNTNKLERAIYLNPILRKTALVVCGIVARVLGYRTEMYCFSCGFIYVMYKKADRLCGLVVRVPGYRTEICCVSCEVKVK